MGTAFLVGLVGLAMSTAPVAAQNSQKLSLDGDFDYATAPESPSLSVTETLTLEVWIKHDGNSDTDAVILDKRSNLTGYQLAFDGSGEEPAVQYTSTRTTLTSNSGIPANRWTHVAVTFAASGSASIYINGKLDAQTSAGNLGDGGSPLYLGTTEAANERFFSGRIDEVRIWSEARSALEIKENRFSSLSGTETNLAAYYPFESGSPTTDQSGSGNGLTLEGDASTGAPDAFPVPPDLYVENEGAGQVSLQWEERGANNGNAADGFELYRSPPGGTANRSMVQSFGASTTSHVATGLANGDTYFWEIVATTSTDASDYSSLATGTPHNGKESEPLRGGASLKLDGDLDYGKVSERPSLSVTGTLTLEVWIKHDGSSDTDAVILDKRSNLTGYQLAFDGSGEEPAVQYTSTRTTLTSNSGIPANRWTHVAVTFAASGSASIYINGKLDAQTSAGNLGDGGSPLYLGTTEAANERFFSGRIDEVRIWDDVRTQSEIQSNYQQELVGDEANLVGYWRFNDARKAVRTKRSVGSTRRRADVRLFGDATSSGPGVFPLPPWTFAKSSDATVDLTWMERVSGESDQFQVYRATAADGSGRSSLTTMSASSTTYTDNQVSNNRNYFYELTTLNAQGQESDFAIPAPTTPSSNPLGNALTLDGDGDYGVVGERPSLSVTGTLTLETWIKHDGYSDTDAVILDKRSNLTGYQLAFDGSGGQPAIQYTSTRTTLTSNSGIPADQWTHVAVTFDASGSASIYINGKLDAQTSAGDLGDGASALYFGTTEAANERFFSGRIDEVRIWDDVRTQSEIQSNYQQELVGNEANLVGYWRFNEVPGSPVSRAAAGRPKTVDLKGDAVTDNRVQPPAISGFTPMSGASGTSVTINGGGFSTTASNNTVRFGSATATVTNATQNSLIVTVPSGAVGPTTITVEKDGESETAARTFTALEARTNVRSLTSTDVGLSGLRNGSVALGDLNGDNHIDVAMVGEDAGGTPVTRLYSNDGDGTYTGMEVGLTGITDGSVALGDLNGDNHLDVVITGKKDDGTPITKLYSNDGSGSFTAMDVNLTGLNNSSVALGDLNGDNHLDVVLTGTNASGAPVTKLYSNDGSGSFTAMNAGLTDLTNGSVALGDLNGDNLIDVAIVGEQSDGTPTTRLYQNEGSGSFSPLSSLTGVTNGSVALGDLNGDNHLDVATVGEEPGGTPVTRLYSNDGSGSFSALNAGLTGVSDGAVALGDLNGNNRLDIAIAGTDADGNGVLDAYRNTPDGWESVRPGPIGIIPQRWGMSFADAEGDGDLDLVAVGNGLGSEATPGAGVFENVYPSPADLSAQVESGEATLSWQKTAGSQLSEYKLYRSTVPLDSTGGTDSLTPVATIGAANSSYTDTGVSEGQTYYYRLTAVASTGEVSPLSTQDYAFLYPGSVTADVSRSFGDASSAGDYRLVALPGQVDQALGGTIDGEAGLRWQAWWDDGSDTNPFVRFDGSPTFDFRKGRGFWLTSQSDWTVTNSVQTVPLEEDTAATISVNEGWTIVSNPFGKSVDWTRVEQANGGDLQPLWGFGGAFEQAATFRSAKTGTAYYFYNDTGEDSLTVPYPGAPQLEALSKADTAQTGSMLALSATPSEMGDASSTAKTPETPTSTVRMGLADSEDSEDAVLAPPARFSAVSLRIEAAEGARIRTGKTNARARLLMASRQMPSGDGETFKVRLMSQTSRSVRLASSNLSAVEGKEVVLLDPAAGRTYDLRADGPIALDVGEESARDLKVAVGSKEYVAQKEEEMLPKKVRLTSYPNPMGGQGTIEYALPDESRVTLRVYDVLGRQVATLEEGRKDAGRHTVQFETGELASGVYFGRLEAGDRTVTKKITVVR